MSLKREVSFRLNWGAFLYGNIFPDFSNLAVRKHSYEATLGVYRCYQKKAKNLRNTEWKRSMALGVVCHFLCDYFCMYHGKKPYSEKSMLAHLCYETLLHIKILVVLFKINTGLLREGNQSVLSAATLNQHRKKDDFNLQAMLKDYEGKADRMLTDITFAFNAVREAMEVVLDNESAITKEEFYEDCNFHGYIFTSG
jgi:hypothetical protein